MKKTPDLLSYIGEDGAIRDELADSWGISDLRFYNTIASTQKIARTLADAGAPSWTLIVADHQTEGRGRDGRSWLSQPGSSVMFSIVIRPDRPEALSLLPVRIGLILARTLDDLLITRGAPKEDAPFIRLKWPNDLIIEEGKIGGILVEGVSRGAEQSIVIGVGINVFRLINIPDDPHALPLRFLDEYLPESTNRLHVLERLVMALREQLRTVPEDLMPKEIEEYARRDWLQGKKLVEPQRGFAVGINRKGYLLLENVDEEIEAIRSGSVRVEERG